MKNEPAFPEYGMKIIEFDGSQSLSTVRAGLTKRELFAMAAMNGFISNPGVSDVDLDAGVIRMVEIADALLKALEASDE